MASIFTNLAFMHGHITDVDLARRLAGLGEEGVQPAKPPRPAKREKVAEVPRLRPSTAPSHWIILGLR